MLLEQLINGITAGCIYALIALGYTMVYGVLGLINFAHAEVYMLGAFLSIIFISSLSNYGFAVPVVLVLTAILAMTFCAGYGFSIEKIAYKPLRNSSRLSPLITAIGVSIFLQNFVMLAQGATDKVLPLKFGTEGIVIMGAKITHIQLAIILCTVLMLLLLYVIVFRTKIGRAMRACSQDMTMASLVGINVDKIISFTFVIAGAMASISALMVVCYYGVINHHIGYIAGIKAFTAAVLGGIGSITGAALGGLILGMAESLGSAYLSSDFKDAYAFAILVIILLIRPSGLLKQHTDTKI